MWTHIRLLLSGSTLLVKEASKHFQQTTRQTIFILLGALWVNKIDLQFIYGHDFHEIMHVCAVQATY